MTASSDTRLEPPDWMRDPEILGLLDTLAEAGVTGRFVGGCVRDPLINRPVNDVDIAVDRDPQTVAKILKDAEIRSIPTGIEHGTQTVPLGIGPVELTSLRRDVETDGRRAVVSFTDDWAEDAARRDFTINALYCDADGQIFDYTDGLKDLAARRIRFIGDAETRIREDVLRILRFFRFHAQLLISQLDADGLEACTRCRDLLPSLSAERVAIELKKILGSPDPAFILEQMQTGRFLEDWLPEITEVDDIDRLGSSEWLLRLALLIKSGDVDPICDRLRFSNQERKRLHAAKKDTPSPKTDAAVRACFYRDGHEASRDQAHLGLAKGDVNWARLLGMIGTWKAPTFPLTGEDAKTAGLSPGPAMGEALKSVETAWIDSDFALAPSDLRVMLRRLANGESLED